MLLLGTRKGAFKYRSDAARRKWRVEGPHFLGNIVNHVVLDPRDGRTLLLAAKTGHLGPTVFRSQDGGRSWKEAKQPPVFKKAKDGEEGRSVQSVFWLSPAHASEPNAWYAGTAPVGMFRSGDGGATWEAVAGFNDGLYPKIKDKVGEVPDGSLLHSILVDPRDARHLYVGISTGGTFDSSDGGKSWQRQDRGLPTEQAWWTVKRQAFCADACESVGLYFGTTSGEIWTSTDAGENWSQIAARLPHIYSVTAAPDS